MAAATPGTIKVVDLSKYVIHRRYVSAITDADTVTTGINGVYKVLTQIGSGNSNNVKIEGNGAGTNLTYTAGSTAATRRMSAGLTTAATGTVTIQSGAGSSTVVLHILASR